MFGTFRSSKTMTLFSFVSLSESLWAKSSLCLLDFLHAFARDTFAFSLLEEPFFLRESRLWRDLIRSRLVFKKRGLSTSVPSLRAARFEIPMSTPTAPSDDD